MNSPCSPDICSAALELAGVDALRPGTGVVHRVGGCGRGFWPCSAAECAKGRLGPLHEARISPLLCLPVAGEPMPPASCGLNN
jgi:hypothetical protein